jgi:hypothetical protein
MMNSLVAPLYDRSKLGKEVIEYDYG